MANKINKTGSGYMEKVTAERKERGGGKRGDCIHGKEDFTNFVTTQGIILEIKY